MPDAPHIVPAHVPTKSSAHQLTQLLKADVVVIPSVD